MITAQNGKGDTPRPVAGDSYRENHARIFGAGKFTLTEKKRRLRDAECEPVQDLGTFPAVRDKFTLPDNQMSNSGQIPLGNGSFQKRNMRHS